MTRECGLHGRAIRGAGQCSAAHQPAHCVAGSCRWSAAKWFAEADKLEANEEQAKNQDALDGMDIGDPELRAALFSAGNSMMGGDGQRAVIIMNA